MGSDRVFGRFALEETIAAGRDVETWRAVMQTPSGAKKRVALKRLKKGLLTPEGAKRFLAEAGRAASLVNPNIVGVLDYGEVDGALYVAQELVDGPTLAHVLKRAVERKEPIVPFPVALFIAAEVCRGLHVAHQRQIVHGDVSPENVLISWIGQIKLSDFGLVRALPRLAQTKGRQRYLTPEKVGLAAADPKFDLFQVGQMLYLMLCGRLPFSGPADDVAKKMVTMDFPRPRSVNPDLTDELEEVLLRSLSLKKGFASAHVLQELLSELFQGSFPGVATNWVGAYVAVFFGEELELAGRRPVIPENVVGAIQAMRTSHSTQRLAPVGDAADASSFDLAPVPSPASSLEALEPLDDVPWPTPSRPAAPPPKAAPRTSTADTANLEEIVTGPRIPMPTAPEPATDPRRRLDSAKTMEKKPPFPWGRVVVVVGGLLVTGLIGYGALRSSRGPPPAPPPTRVVVEDWRTPLKKKLAVIGQRPTTPNRALAFQPLVDELGRKLVDLIDDERGDAERELRFLDAAYDGPPVPPKELNQLDLWLLARARAVLAEDKFDAAVAALQVCPSCPGAKEAAGELVDDKAAFDALLEAERAMVANDYATAREKLQTASDARFFRTRYDKTTARYLEVSATKNPPPDFFVSPLKDKLGLPKRLAALDRAMTADPVLGWHHRPAWNQVSAQVKSATSQRATFEAASALEALEATIKGKKK